MVAWQVRQLPALLPYRWWRGKYGDVADCEVATDVAALPQLARDRGKKRREEAEAKKGRSGAKMGKREREEAKRGAQQQG